MKMEVKNKKNIFAMPAMVLMAVALFALFAVGVSAYVSLATSGQVVPSVIVPGEKANLVLTIANNGNEVASNVKLKFKSNPSVTPDQSSYDLGSIAAANSQVVTVPIKVSDAAAEGTTALVFTIEYTAGSASGATTVENSIAISITKRIQIQIEDVLFSKDVIQQGDEVNFDFTIKNVGKGALKDLRVSLEDYTLPFVYLTNENFIGNIGAGQSAKTSFNIIINKEAKTIAYNLPITLNYYDEAGVLHTDKKYVGIKISGKPEFVVSIDKTENLYAGGVGKISISIANRGTATAEFLTAKFDSGLDVTPSEYYVGNLDPDDTSTISLDVNLRAIANGKHQLNMTMMYKDPYNKDYSENRILNFEITSRPFEISGTTQLVVFVVIIVVLYWKRNFIGKLLKRKKD